MLSILTKVPRRLLCSGDIPSIDVSRLLKQVTKDKFEVKFSRSSGAGGQNVNKVSTKAELRLDLINSPWIPDTIVAKLKAKEKGLVNKNGELVVTSERTRSQHQNLGDALDKVKAMLTEACHVPKETAEETKVKITKLQSRENEKRIENKKRKSFRKFDRKNIE